MAKKVNKVAFLTAGGLAPCLSSAIGYLIDEYTKRAPDVKLIGYLDGYMGLLKGNSVEVTDEMRRDALKLLKHGGSPLGNSRVKLTNVADCVKRGLVKEGEDPLKVAAEQLVKDGVDVLHTIGGDDTNTTAGDLAKYLAANGYELTVVGLPKTVDNDVYPIKQSLGAYTAAEAGARYFWNVVHEMTASPRSLIIHEIMGRNCGWLTAFTGIYYRRFLKTSKAYLVPSFGWTKEKFDINAVYVPESRIDFEFEGHRLKEIMDRQGHVSIFVSEGACVKEIIKEMRKRGEDVPVDAFGHPRLDKVNVGAYFAKRFGEMLGAEKTQVFKSGYYARSASPVRMDLELIQLCSQLAVNAAFEGKSGVVGRDEDNGYVMNIIEFGRVKGGKPFNVRNSRFRKMLAEIGQPRVRKTRVGKPKEVTNG